MRSLNLSGAVASVNVHDWLPPRLSQMPAELKDTPQWVNWLAELRDGKLTKVPKTPAGHNASSTNPYTWASFERVKAAYESGAHGFTGVGFVVSANDDFAALDLDYHNPETDSPLIVNGKLVPSVRELVKKFKSYTELSPSGKGIRIFIRGRVRSDQRKQHGQIAVYSSGRYLTLTGHRIGTVKTIRECQQQLDELIETFGPPLSKSSLDSNSSVAIAPLEPADRELIKDLVARHGSRFIDLFRDGDLTVAGGDHSKADFILMAMILEANREDVPQAVRIFSAGMLGKRDKWIRRADYRARTIAAAREVVLVDSKIHAKIEALLAQGRGGIR